MASPDAARAADRAPGTPPPRRRRWWRVALLLAALPVAAVLAVALIEFRIPLDEFARARIERSAREASGLAVRLEGRLFLVTGLRPGFEITGLVVETGTQGAKLELLRLGVARAEIEVGALLDREVRVRRVLATDVTLRLDAAAHEALHHRGSPRAPNARPAARFTSLRNVQVERARLTLGVPALERSVQIDVDALTLHAPAGEPLTVEANGTFAGEAMKVALRTSTLDQLRSAATTIPLDLSVTLQDVSFTAKGTLEREAKRGDYAVAAAARGSFLERVLPGYRGAAGEPGDASIEGRVRNAPGATSVELATLAVGRTRGRGELDWKEDGGRAAARGRLDFEALDLTPWIAVIREQQAKAPGEGDALDTIRKVQQSADFDLELKSATLMWPERTANDVRLALRAGKDAATIDASARLDTGPLRVQARLETTLPEARLRLGAQAGRCRSSGCTPRSSTRGCRAWCARPSSRRAAAARACQRSRIRSRANWNFTKWRRSGAPQKRARRCAWRSIRRASPRRATRCRPRSRRRSTMRPSR
jgi:hypothetical protein